MIGAVFAALEWAGQFSDPLAWLVLATFLGGTLLAHDSWRYTAPALLVVLGGFVAVSVVGGGVSAAAVLALVVVGAATVARVRGFEGGRYLTAFAWVVFAAFWLSLVYYYGVTSHSIIEGIGSAVAVPGSLYAGYLLARGRDSLFVLSRAVAIMGVIFLPFEAIYVLKSGLIEVVTSQTEFLINLLGFHAPADFTVVNGATLGYTDARSTFRFTDDSGHVLTYTVRIACTGIGSMAIFGGLIGAVRAPLDRKLRGLAVSLPIIYALNLVRNIFIALGFGQQRLQVAPDLVMGLFGVDDAYLVSYLVADKILAQSLSVVALVVITFLVVRHVPEVLGPIEDVLFMATGTEYDLQRVIGGIDPDPVRADGGDDN